MKQVINIIFENPKINEIRENFDKNIKKIRTHLTLVYPFEVSNQQKLEEHIKNSIKDMKSFKITFKGLQKSTSGYYLYLLVSDGKNEIINLYKKLNSGILRGFENHEMLKYIPHITLGIFKTEINTALKELEHQNLVFKTIIGHINLLTLNNDNSIKNIKEFKF